MRSNLIRCNCFVLLRCVYRFGNQHFCIFLHCIGLHLDGWHTDPFRLATCIERARSLTVMPNTKRSTENGSRVLCGLFLFFSLLSFRNHIPLHLFSCVAIFFFLRKRTKCRYFVEARAIVSKKCIVNDSMEIWSFKQLVDSFCRLVCVFYWQEKSALDAKDTAKQWIHLF